MCRPPPPPTQIHGSGGGAPAVLSRRSVCVCVGISRLLRAHHALFAARRHLPLPLWPFSRIRSFIYPGPFLSPGHPACKCAAARSIDTSAGCGATSPDVAPRDDRSPTHVFPFSGSGSLKIPASEVDNRPQTSAAINFLLPEAKIKRGDDRGVGVGRVGGGLYRTSACLGAAAAAAAAQRAISKRHSIRLPMVHLASQQSSARKVSPASPSPP